MSEHPAEKDAPLTRTSYVVTVEHKADEQPILGVSEGARITSVYFHSRVTSPEAKRMDDQRTVKE